MAICFQTYHLGLVDLTQYQAFHLVQVCHTLALIHLDHCQACITFLVPPGGDHTLDHMVASLPTSYDGQKMENCIMWGISSSRLTLGVEWGYLCFIGDSFGDWVLVMKRSEVEHYVLVQTVGLSFLMRLAHYSVLQQSKTIITFVTFWP